MCIYRKLMIVVVLWAVFGATNVLAQPHVHGHSSDHQNQVASPFDQNKQAQSLHCQLKGHTHLGFCPHSQLDKNKIYLPHISIDCGGSRSGTIPRVQSFSSDFAELGFLFPDHPEPGNKLAPQVFLSFFRFIEALDPPPQVL